jgi:hypothetical protein
MEAIWGTFLSATAIEIQVMLMDWQTACSVMALTSGSMSDSIMVHIGPMNSKRGCTPVMLSF